MRNCLIVLGLALGFMGCGGDGGGGTPTTPSPTASSISVDLQDVLLVGRTAVARATATLSNGQTQSLTAGWQSDVPAVARVTDTGTVTGVANGQANIFVIFGGRQGTKAIRVAPNYDGRWGGQQIITACSASGDFAGLCEEEDVASAGESFPVGLTARHPGNLTLGGEFTIEGIEFPTFETQVESDGSIGFSGTIVVEDVTVRASWQINSSQDGRATGTIRETYSVPGLATGEVVFESNLSTFERSSASAVLSPEAPPRVLESIKRRIRVRGR